MFYFKPEDEVAMISSDSTGRVTTVYADGTVWVDFGGENESLISDPESRLELIHRPRPSTIEPKPVAPVEKYDPIHKMTPLPDKMIFV
jgi:hypothetical protein